MTLLTFVLSFQLRRRLPMPPKTAKGPSAGRAAPARVDIAHPRARAAARGCRRRMGVRLGARPVSCELRRPLTPRRPAPRAHRRRPAKVQPAKDCVRGQDRVRYPEAEPGGRDGQRVCLPGSPRPPPPSSARPAALCLLLAWVRASTSLSLSWLALGVTRRAAHTPHTRGCAPVSGSVRSRPRPRPRWAVSLRRRRRRPRSSRPALSRPRRSSVRPNAPTARLSPGCAPCMHACARLLRHRAHDAGARHCVGVCA